MWLSRSRTLTTAARLLLASPIVESKDLLLYWMRFAVNLPWFDLVQSVLDPLPPGVIYR